MVSELDDDDDNNNVVVGGIPQTSSLKVMAHVTTELWLSPNEWSEFCWK